MYGTDPGRLPPADAAAAGEVRIPPAMPACSPNFGVAPEQGAGCPVAGGAAARTGHGPRSGKWDGAGHAAVCLGMVGRMLRLDNIKILNFPSIWGAEGSGAGFACIWPSRSWGRTVGLGVGEDGDGIGWGWGWRADNGCGNRLCSWH